VSDNVVELPVMSVDKLEELAYEADGELADWLTGQMELGISPYTLLGILTLNASWLASVVTEDDESS
jgi:hypothetical protein